jgi:hypothetical protein
LLHGTNLNSWASPAWRCAHSSEIGASVCLQLKNQMVVFHPCGNDYCRAPGAVRIGRDRQPADFPQLDRFEARSRFPTQLLDCGAPLVDRPFGRQFPILVHDAAGESDQDARGHKNGNEEEEEDVAS